MQRNRRFRLLTFVVAALLLCVTGVVVVLQSPHSARAASVPTGLHVVATRLRTEVGTSLFPTALIGWVPNTSVPRPSASWVEPRPISTVQWTRQRSIICLPGALTVCAFP